MLLRNSYETEKYRILSQMKLRIPTYLIFHSIHYRYTDYYNL